MSTPLSSGSSPLEKEQTDKSTGAAEMMERVSNPFSAILNERGTIDERRLAKDVVNALEYDRKYKAEDLMKKRAVRTAASYDEFKNLVAAAGLKKLSRAEVESLGDVKKGWQRGGSKDVAGGGGISSLLSNELQKQADERRRTTTLEEFPDTAGNESGKSVKLPKTTATLERSLRRSGNDSMRIELLAAVGRRKCSTMLTSVGPADIVEEILRILSTALSPEAVNLVPPSTTESPPSRTSTETAETTEATTQAPKKVKPERFLDWFVMLSSLSSFELAWMFASSETRDSWKDYLSAIATRKGSKDSSIATSLLERFG